MKTSPKIITIANQKGGVGKTTTAVNLAMAIAMIFHKKVLLIDMDSQGNATTSLGINKKTLEHTVADVLIDGVPLSDAIIHLKSVDLVGANKDLAGIDVSLAGVENAPLILKKSLKNSKLDYDYIIIDCAPSLSMLTVNALCATDGVIIPMQCEYYALEGVADLMETIDKLSKQNKNLHIKGVVRTMFDNRSTLSQDVSAELVAFFGEKLYKTAIPRSIRLAEAPSFGQSIFEHDLSSKGARAYQNLAAEVIAQDQHQEQQ